ncbi:MFS transporter [Aquisphaera insulae]|uniref:MFS transporter n=1 Tax=Aquisphaera insulae TaxID=2712864 RepID=UPI0013ECE6ED|nr:MFS transporter [Aquisphaera insulae]
MHIDDPAGRATSENQAPLGAAPWWRGVNRYQWFVFVVASLGWLFDTMDQQLFNLARKPAVTKLLDATPGDPATAGMVDAYGTKATSVFMIGWALGGIVFGILGDKIGRAKTMMLTVLCYSAFTGLSALSRNFWDFTFYRFLTGLGVGGQFAVGVALVAEVMPDHARPYALGSLQALSALGNMLAATCGIVLGKLEEAGTIGSAWRVMFLIGLAPALLAIPIFLRLKEPERWKAAAREEEDDAALAGDPKTVHKLGSMSELFTDPRWRRNTIVGMVLAFVGVVGLWGIGFFSFDLIRSVFRKHFEAQGLTAQQIAGNLTLWTGIASLVQNAGSFLGINAFTYVTARIGRRPAFAISFLLAAVATASTFWLLNDFWQIFVLLPIMGFCQLALFGGYAIYFPELFPTRLRSTGTSFCYNVGRLVAASGPYLLGRLTDQVFAGYPEPMRYAGIAMCSVFFLGLLVLPFAPETRGQPLPE